MSGGRKTAYPNCLLRVFLSLAIALTTGRHVSDERIGRRVEICSRRHHVRIHKTRHSGRKLNCGGCGYRLRGRRALVDLARNEETRRRGRKYPVVGGS